MAGQRRRADMPDPGHEWLPGWIASSARKVTIAEIRMHVTDLALGKLLRLWGL